MEGTQNYKANQIRKVKQSPKFEAEQGEKVKQNQLQKLEQNSKIGSKVKQIVKKDGILKKPNFRSKAGFESEPQQNRTVNLLIKSQLLCQLS